MYYVSLTTTMPHPPFAYDSYEAARDAVYVALETMLFTREDPDSSVPGENNALLFQIGPGSTLRLLSEKALQELGRARQQQSTLLQSGLIVPMLDEPKPYKLVIQTSVGQMEPLEFDSREEARSAVENGVEQGYMYHKVRDEDELYIQTGPGTLFIVLSTKNFDTQRRNAVEAAARTRVAGNMPHHPLIR